MSELTYKFDDDDDFEFEIDITEGKEALIYILSNRYKIEKEKMKEIIEDLDLFYLDYIKSFEEEFKDYFEEEALKQYEDNELYNKDPMSYYGLSQKDFI
jgi:hypothetical protein